MPPGANAFGWDARVIGENDPHPWNFKSKGKCKICENTLEDYVPAIYSHSDAA